MFKIMNLITKILLESEEEENLFKPRRMNRPDIRTEKEKKQDEIEESLKQFLEINNIETRYIQCDLFGRNDLNIELQIGLTFPINRSNQRYVKYFWYQNANKATIGYTEYTTDAISISNKEDFFNLILSDILKHKAKNI